MPFKKGQSGNPQGRHKGAANKATAEVKALAQAYTADVITRLAYLALKAESEQAQVAACKELLDRGHGRSVQSVNVNGAVTVPLFAMPAGAVPSVSKQQEGA